jgi:hypothetical protein
VTCSVSLTVPRLAVRLYASRHVPAVPSRCDRRQVEVT